MRAACERASYVRSACVRAAYVGACRVRACRVFACHKEGATWRVPLGGCVPRACVSSRACRRVRAAACVPPRVSACMPPRAYVPSPACRCVRARGVACVPPRVCHHVACRRVRAARVLCTFRRSVPPVRAAGPCRRERVVVFVTPRCVPPRACRRVRAAACRRACRRVRACRGLVYVGSLESCMGNVNARYAVVALSGQHGWGMSLMSANRNLSPIFAIGSRCTSSSLPARQRAMHISECASFFVRDGHGSYLTCQNVFNF